MGRVDLLDSSLADYRVSWRKKSVKVMLMDYMQELREGGYPYKIREEILEAGLKGYARMWQMQCDKVRFINRPGKATETKRRVQRRIGQKKMV